jgi:hypothetical protein
MFINCWCPGHLQLVHPLAHTSFCTAIALWKPSKACRSFWCAIPSPRSCKIRGKSCYSNYIIYILLTPAEKIQKVQESKMENLPPWCRFYGRLGSSASHVRVPRWSHTSRVRASSACPAASSSRACPFSRDQLQLVSTWKHIGSVDHYELPVTTIKFS